MARRPTLFIHTTAADDTSTAQAAAVELLTALSDPEFADLRAELEAGRSLPMLPNDSSHLPVRDRLRAVRRLFNEMRSDIYSDVDMAWPVLELTGPKRETKPKKKRKKPTVKLIMKVDLKRRIQLPKKK